MGVQYGDNGDVDEGPYSKLYIHHNRPYYAYVS